MIVNSTTTFYREKDIKTLLFPTTTLNVSSPMGLGSDSTPVGIILDNQKAYLSDSMQFLLEYSCRFFNKGCYSIMPCYRGEIPDNRHLSQFFQSEVEIPGKMDNAIDLAESYIKYLSRDIIREFGYRILKFNNNLEHVERLISCNSFPRIKFNDALKYLNKNEFYHDKKSNYRILTIEGEQKLMDRFNGFVWITHFDHLSMPFYQAFNGINNSVAKSADLLLGMGELIGLGERHINGNNLKKALKLHKIRFKEYNWYIELKHKYPMKTSGFGMGIERYLCWIMKHDDIRNCQLFLRFKNKNAQP